jgi:type IV secretory pathway VirJ component
MKRVVLASVVLLAALPAWAGVPSSKPGLFEVRDDKVTLNDHVLKLTLVKPTTPRPPQLMILLVSGDAGWMGAAGDVFEHLAESGHPIAAFDSREVTKWVKRSGGLVEIPDAAAAVDSVLVQARKLLGLPETTPVIVSGYSRGASLVVFTAAVPRLQHHLTGALAVALTRETDYLKAPADARPGSVDEKGRIQTYPAIARAGSIPFAVIQAKGDKYVPAEEARRLFGADTATRHLYEVDASNHGFRGGHDELMRDLDDALAWIEGAAQLK